MKAFLSLRSVLACVFLGAIQFAAAQTVDANNRPYSVSIYYRLHTEAWQWFAAPPYTNSYAYVESLLRLGIAQRIHAWDWELELSQPSLLDLPTHAISPNPAQGQLGFGGTFYASNDNNAYSAAGFLKQGFLRYNFPGSDKNLRLGRYEFFDGAETQPRNATIRWLQTYRVAQRLIGNFGLVNAQRSFDGIDGHYGNLSAGNGNNWDITAMASRADQGAFTDNGNPELNVDLQYLAYTGCGKTLVSRRVLHLRQNFSPFRPFSLRISAFVLRLEAVLPASRHTSALLGQ